MSASRRVCLRRKRAFTLMEVVVAMALFVMAVGMLAQAANNGLKAVIAMSEQIGRGADLFFLREKILAIESKDEMEIGGEIMTPASGKVTWEAYVYPTTAADLFFLTLVFEFPASETLPEATVTQTLYVYRAAWSESADRKLLMDKFEQELNNYRPVRSEESQNQPTDA